MRSSTASHGRLICSFSPMHHCPPPHTHQGKQYGGSTVWGQEFTELLAFTDFKSKETTYPWIRLALGTCQMCASKPYIRDGISKLVNPSDFSKLKQKGMVVQVAAAEKLLMEAWQLCQSSPLTLDQKAQPMGRLLCFCLERVPKALRQRSTNSWKKSQTFSLQK